MSDAILLLNLGSPAAPRTKEVRNYLNEFLMDGRVLDIAWPLRRLITGLFILPFRPKESAKAYQSIWLDEGHAEGSPLIKISQEFSEALAAKTSSPVYLAMRYGRPSVREVLAKMAQDGRRKIKVAPLYPHYALSSYETVAVLVYEEIERLATKMNVQMQADLVLPFYNQPDYIHSLAQTIKEHNWSGQSQADYHFLFSYHGIPERHVTKTDPTGGHCLNGDCCAQPPGEVASFCYRHQVLTTTQLVAEQLGIAPERYSVAFQSRLGRIPWLAPYTDRVLEELPARGIKKVAVLCPSFVADCLETLEEMDMRGRDTFMAAGGESFERIHCLNTAAHWVDAFLKIKDDDNYVTPLDDQKFILARK